MIGSFLRDAGWSGAARAPLAGDASARRYERVTRTGASAVLMIAPPADRAGFDAFIAMAAYLRGCGLSAPEVLAADREAGLMLLEDFGDAQIALLASADPAREPELYRAACDVLVALAACPLAPGLVHLTPARLLEMVQIGLDLVEDKALTAEIEAQLGALFAAQLDTPPMTVLRDYHAENLIWLPDREGVARVGLLDFQDAVAGPAGYDLVSLLDDARRDLPAPLKAELIAAHARELGVSHDNFALTCALLSVQRNLRIMGVFARLARERGKPSYLRHMPRVAVHIRHAAEHPVLQDLAAPLARLTDRALMAVTP